MRLATLLLLSLVALWVAPAQAGRAGGTHPTLVVAIDPGHGGRDQGAVGPRRTREKDVALQIARRLQRLVSSQPGMRAVLTRHGDQFLHLYERIAIARRHAADLFISIHADAVANPDSRGSSVFVLSTRGASSAAAYWLAKRENDADTVGAAYLEAKDKALRAVVFDIYQDAVMAESMALANHVLRRLRRMAPLHTGGVERAGFAVLKAPNMPSILVETGFISNASEEARLRNVTYQQRLAEAILQGIHGYIRQRGTSSYRMAASPMDRPPVVRRVSRPAARSTASERGRQAAGRRLTKPAVELISKPLSRPHSMPAVTLIARPTAEKP